MAMNITFTMSVAFFMFGLGQIVKLTQTEETGIVIAQAQYLTGEISYLIRYKAADGRLVEQWWGESALEAN